MGGEFGLKYLLLYSSCYFILVHYAFFLITLISPDHVLWMCALYLNTGIMPVFKLYLKYLFQVWLQRTSSLVQEIWNNVLINSFQFKWDQYKFCELAILCKTVLRWLIYWQSRMKSRWCNKAGSEEPGNCRMTRLEYVVSKKSPLFPIIYWKYGEVSDYWKVGVE